MKIESDWLFGRDISVFDAVPSQTSRADRRAMLGVHAAVNRAHGEFTYLEIGSHLGGSIQPYLLNPDCTWIYSIDARPEATPDDRVEGYTSNYPENSTARMLELLSRIDADAVSKIVTFDSDASEVDPAAIDVRPLIAMIDGEHTARAVRSDFAFCIRVIAEGGVILFHDYRILRNAIADAEATLIDRPHLGFRVEGDVYGIFTDPGLVRHDPYLSERYRQHQKMRRFYPLEWAWLKVRDLLLLPKRLVAREYEKLS